MTAPLPPHWLDVMPETRAEVREYAEEFAKLAVREALERAAQMLERAQVRMKLPGQQAFCVYDANMAEEIRAMIEEYKND